MMTREEAIKWLEETIQDTDTYLESCSEALQKELDEQKEVFDLAITALRPVSREQVEKVWRGEWHRHYKSGIHAGNGVVCSKCDMWNNRTAHFCPACGAPMTDEAVDMVMERMEEME